VPAYARGKASAAKSVVIISGTGADFTDHDASPVPVSTMSISSPASCGRAGRAG